MNSTNVCKVVSGPGVIRASNIKVSEGLRPKRIVLRHLEEREEFVVHTEYLDISIEGTGNPVAFFSHSGFDQGDYYGYGEYSERSKEQAHADAVAKFAKRAEGFGY